MDPELLALLFSTARGSNKGTSGALSAMRNPMFAYLAGAYNPMSAVDEDSGAMPLTMQYANTEDPVVRQILQQIDMGANEFEIGSFLSKLDAEDPGLIAESGWQFEDLRGLSKELARERQNSSKARNDQWWSKAGLSSPLDVYDESNIQVDLASQNRILEARKRADAARRRAEQAATRVGTAESSAKRADEQYKAFMKRLRQEMSGAGGSQVTLSLRRAFDEIKGLEKSGGATKQQIESILASNAPSDAYAESYGRRLKNLSAPSARSADIKKGSQSVMTEKLWAEEQAKRGDELASAVKRGIVRAMNESGRTPLGDEMQMMMRFLGQSNV